MIGIIGDTIAALPELREGDPLPSPESLRGKIVIKGKVVKEGEVGQSCQSCLIGVPVVVALPIGDWSISVQKRGVIRFGLVVCRVIV